MTGPTTGSTSRSPEISVRSKWSQTESAWQSARGAAGRRRRQDRGFRMGPRLADFDVVDGLHLGAQAGSDDGVRLVGEPSFAVVWGVGRRVYRDSAGGGEGYRRRGVPAGRGSVRKKRAVGFGSSVET